MRKKVVLAYSGGLDTSIILKWLQLERNLDVIAFIADVGQKDELETAKLNALKMGAYKVIVKDLKNIFVKDYIFPMSGRFWTEWLFSFGIIGWLRERSDRRHLLKLEPGKNSSKFEKFGVRLIRKKNSSKLG